MNNARIICVAGLTYRSAPPHSRSAIPLRLTVPRTSFRNVDISFVFLSEGGAPESRRTLSDCSLRHVHDLLPDDGCQTVPGGDQLTERLTVPTYFLRSTTRCAASRSAKSLYKTRASGAIHAAFTSCIVSHVIVMSYSQEERRLVPRRLDSSVQFTIDVE
jgi:hypothetical protein